MYYFSLTDFSSLSITVIDLKTLRIWKFLQNIHDKDSTDRLDLDRYDSFDRRDVRCNPRAHRDIPIVTCNLHS